MSNQETWTRILREDAASELDNRHLRKLRKYLGKELKRRRRTIDALQPFCNFMAGVTWAMACRSALRQSKHHTPHGGKRPASGEMWTPREIMKARGLHLARYEWDPLTAKDWDEVRRNLVATAAKARREAELKGPVIVTFRVPYAGEHAAVCVTPEFTPEA